MKFALATVMAFVAVTITACTGSATDSDAAQQAAIVRNDASQGRLVQIAPGDEGSSKLWVKPGATQTLFTSGDCRTVQARMVKSDGVDNMSMSVCLGDTLIISNNSVGVDP